MVYQIFYSYYASKLVDYEKRLKVYRARHDLTQEELVKKLGISRQTIIAIEKGKYDPPLLG